MTPSMTKTQKRERKKNSKLETLMTTINLNNKRKDKISKISRDNNKLLERISRTKVNMNQKNRIKLNTGGAKRTFRG